VNVERKGLNIMSKNVVLLTNKTATLAAKRYHAQLWDYIDAILRRAAIAN